MIPDEQLDYWGDFYVRYGFASTGVTFERFLANPRRLAPKLLRRVQVDRDFQRALAGPRVRAITKEAC